MRLATALVAVVLLAAAATGFAADTFSTFDNFNYGYTITPAMGEQIRSFKIYTAISEYDATHYYNLVMPAGWMFDVVCDGEKCAITWWTEGEALPVGEPAAFGYTHYCAPCCHSWYLSDEGSSALDVNVVDDDEQHTEACNIPAEFGDMCGGPGLMMAPIYPNAVGNDVLDWGGLKAQYK